MTTDFQSVALPVELPGPSGPVVARTGGAKQGTKRGRNESLEARFWAKVSKDGPVKRPELGPCWEWLACRDRKGYGRFSLAGRKIAAHRLSFELAGGAADGLILDHLCRNPRCVRPGHLEAVSNRENVLRGASLAAANAKKTSCPRGHVYSPENTAVFSRYGSGQQRQCRACKADRKRWPHLARAVAP